MKSRMIVSSALSAIVICALIPRPADSQVATTAIASARRGALGYLGIENVRCNCTFRADDDGNRVFTFRSNPVVLGVYEGSPADGSLVRGDTITAIDGVSLLSADGGRRFANIRPGQRVTLDVSRGRAQMTLLLHASSVSGADERSSGFYAPEASGRGWTYDFPAQPAMPAMPAMPAIPSMPSMPSMPAPAIWSSRSARAYWPAQIAPVPPVPPVPPVAAVPAVPAVPPVPAVPASPTGWFGFSIRCTQCGWSMERGDDSPVWESATAPELSMVAPGSPAGRAGLLAGDRITEIDGVSILSPRGARKFGGARPGQTIRVTVLRDGRTLTREMMLATRPEMRAAIAAISLTPRASAARRELRYTGQLSDVSVEVWSAGGPTVERVGDTMLITVGGSVVRLKLKK